MNARGWCNSSENRKQSAPASLCWCVLKRSSLIEDAVSESWMCQFSFCIVTCVYHVPAQCWWQTKKGRQASRILGAEWANRMGRL